MRSPFLLVLLLLLPAVSGGQASGPPARWALTLGGDLLRFSEVARDTVAAPNAQARLRPTGRLALQVGLARRLGKWEAAIETGWAGGHVQASNDVIAIEDRASDLTRYRLAALMTRRVLVAGAGVILGTIGPTLDVWSVDGERRVRGGVEARIAVRVPLGSLEWENRLGVGLGGSPIENTDFEDGFRQRPLRVLGFGSALRVRL